jgi:hypothetical protein
MIQEEGMSFSPKFFRQGFVLAAMLAIVMLAAPMTATAQFYDLEVQVGDTVGYPATLNSAISVYMKNYSDTVAGFELWLMLDRPDRIIFQTNLDTVIDTTRWRCIQYSGPNCIDSVVASLYWVCTQYSGNTCIDSIMQYGYYRCDQYQADSCIDSTFIPGWDWMKIDTTEVFTGNYDTVGTLTRGWEYIQTRSLGGQGFDIKITAQANTIPPPYKRGIGPQYGTTPLIKLLADILPVPSGDTDRTVRIMIQANNLDNFAFTDQKGDLIGVYTDTVTDTVLWRCQDWANPPQNTICLLWEVVPEAPYDSMSFRDVLVGRLDTSKVYLDDGSLTVLRGKCGDVNNNGVVNILDVTYLIAYLYKGGPTPPVLSLANANGTWPINILDATYLIAYLYKGGPDPRCS